MYKDEILEAGWADDGIRGFTRRMISVWHEGEGKREERVVRGEFNGIILTCLEASTEESIYNEWYAKSNAEADAYLASPEHQAELERDENELSRLQVKCDQLVQELAILDFKDMTRVLDWLCSFEKVCKSFHDNVGEVVRPTERIINIFRQHGFSASEKSIPRASEENSAKEVARQALFDLRRKGAIGQSIHHFTVKWKKMFASPN